MQSSSDPEVEEIPMSSTLDMAEEVWQQALTEFLTEDQDSFKSALGAFKQDLKHNLDGVRTELSTPVGQQLQATRDSIERNIAVHLSAMSETCSSWMKVVEERINTMGECLSTRLQALEQRVGELDWAGASLLLQHQTAQGTQTNQSSAG